MGLWSASLSVFYELIKTYKASGLSAYEAYIQLLNTSWGSKQDLQAIVHMVYDALDGETHAQLAAQHPEHEKMHSNTLGLITGINVFGVVIQVKDYEFLVSTDIPDTIAVAGLLNGEFVVTYSISGAVWSVIYNADAQLVKAKFQVTATGTSPAVGSLTEGRFVICYESDDGDQNGIFCIPYNSNYNADGSVIQANSNNVGNQQNTQIVGTPSGGFVTVWQEDNDVILFQAFDVSYSKADENVQVTADNKNILPSIAVFDTGRIAISWSNGIINVHTNMIEITSIQFRLFGPPNKDGSYTTSTAVNVFHTSDVDGSYGSKLAAFGTDYLVGVWVNVNNQGDVFFKKVDLNDLEDTRLIAGTRVNEYATNAQFDPVLIFLNDGNLVFGWTSTGQDGSGDGVYGTVFEGSGYSNSIGDFGISNSTIGDQSQVQLTNITNGLVGVFISTGGIYARTYDLESI